LDKSIICDSNNFKLYHSQNKTLSIGECKYENNESTNLTMTNEINSVATKWYFNKTEAYEAFNSQLNLKTAGDIKSYFFM